VTINGAPATLNASTGNYEAGVAAGFGMVFANVVARDQFGHENSTTCTVLVAASFTGETATMAGAIGMRLDPSAIGDAQPTGLNSINDILHTILNSAQLRSLVDGGLIAANPINSGDCGIVACTPTVSYNRGTIGWDQPNSTLSLIPGGLQAQIHAAQCRAQGRRVQHDVLHRRLDDHRAVELDQRDRAVQPAAPGRGAARGAAGQPDHRGHHPPSSTARGFCGFLVDLLQGFFTGTVGDAVHDALVSFINTSVAPLLDQLVSSLDINTLGAAFSVPRLDGSGSIGLQFGLAFSSFEITTARALLGIGTRFTPASTAQNRPSLGVPRRTANALLDPPGTSTTRPVGLALYEGVLNQVLHGLWRGGLFQASLQLGAATATIDAQLPPVAVVSGSGAQLMLGGIQSTIRIPGFIDTPIPIVFGGLATASVTLSGDALRFGNLTLTQLFVSFQTSLTQVQRDAMAGLLTQILQTSLADAINAGLPAFPIPTFALPASAAAFGLPAGAQLGILSPQLSSSGQDFVLTGAFGVRN